MLLFVLETDRPGNPGQIQHQSIIVVQQQGCPVVKNEASATKGYSLQIRKKIKSINKGRFLN